MTRTYLPIFGLVVLSALIMIPAGQYASATPPSVTVSGGFIPWSYGDLRIHGTVTNAEPNTWLQLQVYAPDNQLVLDKKINLGNATGPFTAGFGEDYTISRDQGKGNYTVIATYHNHFTAQTQVPSWINNDPVVSVSAQRNGDGSVVISGRVLNDIRDEPVSISIRDPAGSTTANYTVATAIQGQFENYIYYTEAACEADLGDPSLCPGPFASSAFPTTGNYTITVTHTPTGIAGQEIFHYVQNGGKPLPPGQPTNLSATAVSSSQINLSWTAPVNSGVLGYYIHKSTDGGATWTLIQSAGPSTTRSDTGLSANTTYTYYVTAVNSAGESASSNTASATTLP